MGYFTDLVKYAACALAVTASTLWAQDGEIARHRSLQEEKPSLCQRLKLIEGEEEFDSLELKLTGKKNTPKSKLEAKLNAFYAMCLAGFRDKFGEKMFDFNEILRFAKERIPLNTIYALIYAKDGLDGATLDATRIYHYSQLRASPADLGPFVDTKKPNAVLMYHVVDDGPAFYSPHGRDLFRLIKKGYDVYVRVAAKEEELYQALDKIPNIELLMICGHGSQRALSFGEGDPRLHKTKQDETYVLDVGDQELSRHAQNLAPNAVIFLNSCLNGEGGQNKANLANFVMRCFPGRTVISAKRAFYASEIEVEDIYPFEVTFCDKVGKDFTYCKSWGNAQNNSGAH